MAMDLGPGAPRLVLFGYSKGTPDVLEAIVNHPEIRPRVAAVVSIAGAVGGSPLANEAEQYQADLLRHFPGAACDSRRRRRRGQPAHRRAQDLAGAEPACRATCRPTRS